MPNAAVCLAVQGIAATLSVGTALEGGAEGGQVCSDLAVRLRGAAGGLRGFGGSSQRLHQALMIRKVHMSQTKSPIGTYLVNGIAGNEGTPGAPILRFSLVVNAASGKVNGQVQLTQALPPPYGQVEMSVSGQIHGAGFGPITQLVALEGETVVSVPPPAIGSYLAQFKATFAINGDWQGRGGWTFANQTVSDVPVHTAP